MSLRLKYTLPALLQLSAVMLAASTSQAAWENGVSYGGTLKMDLYTPSKLAASPAIVVAIHYCTGNSGSTHSWFQSLADKYGFYIISPDAGKQCFDASAKRDGDKAAVAKMVDWVITQKKADKTRVVVAGASSGGCMTNTLLALYPDVFACGAALPGFPAGGWPSGDTSCTKCGSSPPNQSAKQWGDIARNAFSWTGARPKVQQWVGTSDQYNFNGWLPAVVLQFQDLLGLDAGTKGAGPSGWDRTEYKDSSGNVMLQTNIGQGKPHDLTGQVPYAEIVSFCGLDKDPGTTPTGTGGAGSTGGASGAASGGKSSVSGGAGGAGGSSTSGNPSTGGKSGAGASSSGGAASKGGSSAAESAAKGGKTGSGGSAVTATTKASSKGGASAKGGASSAATTEEEGGTANGSQDTGDGGTSEISSKAQSTSASAKGGSKSSSTTSKSGTTTSSPAEGGGSPAPSGSAAIDPADVGGCSCTIVGDSRARNSALSALAGVVLGLALRRRRRIC